MLLREPGRKHTHGEAIDGAFVEGINASFSRSDQTPEVGDWDRSVGTNTPGQSGDPDSPHYRDLYEPWAAVEDFPSFFSRAKVELVMEAKTVLLPGRMHPDALEVKSTRPTRSR